METLCGLDVRVHNNTGQWTATRQQRPWAPERTPTLFELYQCSSKPKAFPHIGIRTINDLMVSCVMVIVTYPQS